MKLLQKHAMQLLTLIGYHFANFKFDEGHVLAWHDALKDYTPDEVKRGYENLINSNISFTPTVSEVARSARIIRYPMLAYTPEQHRQLETPFWRRACSKYIRIPAYNPWASAEAALKPRDLDQLEKTAMQKLQSGIDRMLTCPLGELDSYIKKIENGGQTTKIGHEVNAIINDTAKAISHDNN